MPITKESLKRRFLLKRSSGDTPLPDPDPSMTPDEVLQFYANSYPELVTSTCQGPVYDGDTMTYSFQTVVGTKG